MFPPLLLSLTVSIARLRTNVSTDARVSATGDEPTAVFFNAMQAQPEDDPGAQAHANLGEGAVPMALPLELVLRILHACTPATLCKTARACREWHDLSIPLLYRDITLDLCSLSTFSGGHHSQVLPRQSGVDAAALSPGFYGEDSQFLNPRILQYVQNLHILPHHWARCCPPALGASLTPPRLPFRALRSVHFEVDITTYHWPYSCTLLHAISPTPRELIISADPSCDVLYWTFASRCYESLPAGIDRLVLRVQGERPGGMARRNSLKGLLTGCATQGAGTKDTTPRLRKRSTIAHVIIDYQGANEGGLSTSPVEMGQDPFAGEVWMTGADSLLESLDPQLELELDRIAVLALTKIAARITVRGLLSKSYALADPGEQESVTHECLHYHTRLLSHEKGEGGRISDTEGYSAFFVQLLRERLVILIRGFHTAESTASAVSQEVQDAVDRVRFESYL